jgi:hypothetical protein
VRVVAGWECTFGRRAVGSGEAGEGVCEGQDWPRKEGPMKWGRGQRDER